VAQSCESLIANYIGYLIRFGHSVSYMRFLPFGKHIFSLSNKRPPPPQATCICETLRLSDVRKNNKRVESDTGGVGVPVV